MAKWWKESVVYQIYPRSFNDSNNDGIGDIKGITEKLDYIKDLGVDIIWLSPVYQSPNDDYGYDISNYYSINKEFGTIEDFDELLRECHNKGLKLIMDLVINHTSDEHPWFIESRSSKDNPKRDYYIWRKGKGNRTPNNWQSYFSESAWEYDEKTDEYYLHLFSKKQPDLNWENEDVQKNVTEMITWWLDKGIDGFRIDMVNVYGKPAGLPNSNLIVDGQNDMVFDPELYANEEGTHKVLKMLNKNAFSKYDIMTVGEAHTVTPKEGLNYVDKKRKEINMLIFFQHLQVKDVVVPKKKLALYKFLAENIISYLKSRNKKIDLVDFKRTQRKWYKVIKKGGWYTQYMSNHDQPRQVSRFGDDDKYRVESAKMLATILHTMPGTPFIYQGEEIGMTNFHLPAIEEYKDIGTINAFKKAIDDGIPKGFAMKIVHGVSRDNARFPMQWNEDKNAGFTAGEPWLPVNNNYKEINVENDLSDENSILNYYKKLIALRKENRIIVKGDFTIINKSNPDIISYIREFDNEKWLITANFTNKKRTFNVPNNISIQRMELILSNYIDADTHYDDKIVLLPYQSVIIKLISSTE